MVSWPESLNGEITQEVKRAALHWTSCVVGERFKVDCPEIPVEFESDVYMNITKEAKELGCKFQSAIERDGDMNKAREIYDKIMKLDNIIDKIQVSKE